MRTRYSSVPEAELKRFVGIVRRLRHECPWDREQTHQSLRDGLIEETYEVVESIEERNIDELKKELGDLLLHVVMHATIAEQAEEFTLKDVVQEISSKLVRRHPHVFGTARVRDADDVKHRWESLKMSEGRSSVLEGVPRGMPALHRAQRLQERAAKVGFEWKRVGDVWKKVLEELREVRASVRQRSADHIEEEFGDLLFALVNYARFIGVNPEQALHRSNEKFTRRFHYIERQLKTKGKDIHRSTLKEMDGLWNEAKRAGH